MDGEPGAGKRAAVVLDRARGTYRGLAVDT